MKFLVDTSALVGILRRQVDPLWFDLTTRGLIAICEPVLVETLTVAEPKAYERAEENLRKLYPWVPVPDDAWQLVCALRQELAGHRSHRGLSVADYLVIATAIRTKLVVLHQDPDFEVVARVVPELSQERIG